MFLRPNMHIMDLQVVNSARHSLMSSEPRNSALQSLLDRGKQLFPIPLVVVVASSHELPLLLNFAARYANMLSHTLRIC